jgi:four helix bundle protein
VIYDVSDLEVYKVSLDLYKELKAVLRETPFSGRDIVRNCDRAAQSIPANIAEGFAKKSSEATFRFHLKVALGSSDEVVTHLRTLAISFPNKSISFLELAEKYKVLSKRLNSLHKNWHSYSF